MFIVVVFVVRFWLSNQDFYTHNINHCSNDMILGIINLSSPCWFKIMNHITSELYLKINALLASNNTENISVVIIDKIETRSK